MNVLKTTLSVTATLVLAACGNGGTYQPELTNTPTVTPKPPAPSANAGGTGGSSSAAANNNAGGGTSSGSSATGGNSAATPPAANGNHTGTQPSTPPATGSNTSTSQPPAGSGNAGTTPPNTGNASGSPATGGSNSGGTQPTTPPATGTTPPNTGNASGSPAAGGNNAGTQPTTPPATGTTPPNTGNVSGSPAAGGNNAGTQPTTPPATGTTPPNTGNVSGSPAAGGNNAGTQPTTPPATGTTPPNTGNASGSPAAGGNNAGTQPNTNNQPALTIGNANANYARGYVATADSRYYERNPLAPVSPALGGLSGDIASVDRKFNVEFRRSPENTDYERITIDGVTLSLLPGKRLSKLSDKGKGPDKVVGFDNGGEVSDKLGLVAGKWLQYSSYGAVDPGDEGLYGLPYDRRYVFAHGEPTISMPVSGTAAYSGYLVSYGGLHRPHKARDGYGPVKIQFNVDFGRKKVTGQSVSHLVFTVDADITGNRFEGISKDGHTLTKGGFYGPNAAEMAGTMVKIIRQSDGSVGVVDASLSGMAAFGAKKVNPKYNKTGVIPEDQK